MCTSLELSVDEGSFYSVVLVTYKHLLEELLKKSEQLFHVFISNISLVDFSSKLKYPLVNFTGT